MRDESRVVALLNALPTPISQKLGNYQCNPPSVHEIMMHNCKFLEISERVEMFSSVLWQVSHEEVQQNKDWNL